MTLKTNKTIQIGKTSTAYGKREAKLVIHIPHDSSYHHLLFKFVFPNTVKGKMSGLEVILDKLLHNFSLGINNLLCICLMWLSSFTTHFLPRYFTIV